MRGPCILMMLLLPGVPVSAETATAPGLSESARQLADRAADRLGRVDGTPAVAVFPFSGPEGRITAEMGNVPAFLQGEMIHRLAARSGDRFLVLNKAMLARRFKDRGVSPARIDPSDPERTAAVLRQVGIDAAVLGSMDRLQPYLSIEQRVANPDAEDPKDVNVHAWLTFADGNVHQLVSSIDWIETQQHMVGSAQSRLTADPKQRLKVEILVGGRALPLLQCRNPESSFHGDLFLILQRAHLGREFQIRITNRGTPPIGSYSGKYDRERMIGVSVFVDGINSRFMKDAYGDFAPVSRPPHRVPRWLLTPPGYVVRRGGQRERWDTGGLRINDGRLVRTSGDGNSVLTLRGFQVDDKTAHAFVFGDAADSLAEEVGITKEIGQISIYVFPEVVPEEQVTHTVYMIHDGVAHAESRVGVIAGPPLPHTVRGFQVQLVEDFRQVWRIHYRLEGERLPVPRSDLVSFRQ